VDIIAKRIITSDISRTFYEFLMIPGLTRKKHTAENVSLRTPLARFQVKNHDPVKGIHYNEWESGSRFYLNIPFTSAVMQAVSGPELGITLAQQGGLSFIYQSQSIDSQAAMVSRVKRDRAGFIESDANLPPNVTLEDAIKLTEKTGHSTIAVTENGTAHGKLLGILTDRDYFRGVHPLEMKVKKLMTPVVTSDTSRRTLIYHEGDISLDEATRKIARMKISCLPVLGKDGNLQSMIFRKDVMEAIQNKGQLLDEEQRRMIGAGINTRDYKERVPALLNAGVDVLCFDSSDGYNEWQGDAIRKLRKEYGNEIILGGGNVVSRDGFNYLARAGVDFIKIGIGGGSICITREQKGIGLGQASAVIDVVKARDDYFKKTGVYIPTCSDGGITSDSQMSLALAFGADFLMMGRYFAGCKESPPPIRSIKMGKFKPYWGEGTDRAQNWQRYEGEGKLSFEEGVDGFVPLVGELKDVVNNSLDKIRASMCNLGSLSLYDLNRKAVLKAVSQATLVENAPHDILGAGDLARLDSIAANYGKTQW